MQALFWFDFWNIDDLYQRILPIIRASLNQEMINAVYRINYIPLLVVVLSIKLPIKQ